jgi:hypothetical protein
LPFARLGPAVGTAIDRTGDELHAVAVAAAIVGLGVADGLDDVATG